MSEARIDIPFDGLDDAPRALRTSAAVGAGIVLRINSAEAALKMARRLERGAEPPAILIVEVDRLRGHWQSILDAVGLSLHVYVWLFGIMPALGRAIIGALQ